MCILSLTVLVSLSAVSSGINSVLPYKFVNIRKNWYDADLYCQKIFGTRLGIIKNSHENSIATSICHGHGHECWIGVNDQFIEGTFKYSNGNHVTYTNWARHEPNNFGYIIYL